MYYYSVKEQLDTEKETLKTILWIHIHIHIHKSSCSNAVSYTIGNIIMKDVATVSELQIYKATLSACMRSEGFTVYIILYILYTLACGVIGVSELICEEIGNILR